MELNTKTLFAFVLVATLAFSGGYLISGVELQRNHRDPQVKANLYVFYETARGSWSGQSGNLITDLGENYVRNTIGFNNVTQFNYTRWISLSNAGTPLDTWTELDTEVAANGFTRAIGTASTWMNGTDYAFNVTKKFTATGTQQLQTAGLQWNDTASSDNNLFAAADFSQTTFESNDNLTITWVITWDAND